jgi:hypothetical protein
MPCCALVSVSLIILVWTRSASSSLTTVTNGPDQCRCTYDSTGKGWETRLTTLGIVAVQKSSLVMG